MKLPALLPIRIAVAVVCLTFPCFANTLVVTSTEDSGPGTLRDALAQAQPSDTITFAVTGILTNSSAELTISNDINIIGPGPDVLAVMGNSNAAPRIFTILDGVSANISGLTLRDSDAGQFNSGGAISNAGTLSLTNCVFTRCKSGIGIVISGPVPGGSPGSDSYHGGAIYSVGPLTAINCDFFSDSAAAGTDGVDGPAGTGGTGGYGGAIFTTSTLLAMNCNFLTNSAGKGGTGGAGYISGPLGSPTGSAGGDGGYGGAIYSGASATFINCTFGWNVAGAGGLAGSGLSGGPSQPYGGNGGAGGKGGHGGAIYSQDQLTLTSCTFYQNHAGAGNNGGAGGGGYQAPGGVGGPGGNGGHGSVYCVGSAQITACTFCQNGAGGSGSGGSGGAGGTGRSGGIGGNGGSGGNGGAVYAAAATPSVSLHSALLIQDTVGGLGTAGAGGANGTGSGTAPSGTSGANGTGYEIFGDFASLGHNFVRTNGGSSGLTNGINSDVVNSNLYVVMSPLSAKGGRTLTCVLMSYVYPIVDGGDDAIMGPPLNLTTDQRGQPRLSGAHVDVGATEIISPMMPLVPYGSISNGVFYLTMTNTPGLNPLPQAIFKPTNPSGIWLTVGMTMVEVAPGVYQMHQIATSFPQYFRVHMP